MQTKNLAINKRSGKSRQSSAKNHAKQVMKENNSLK